VQDDLILYGRLQEKVHTASYSFERASRDLEALLEGNRWKLGGRFEVVDDFMNSLGLDKLRATAEQRSRIAKRIKELQPAVSNRRIAKTLGVSKDTVRGDLSPPDQKNTKGNKEDKLASGENSPPVTGTRAAQIVKRHIDVAVSRQANDDERRKALHRRVQVASGLHVGDFRELSPGLIADNSVELVFTDPPYDRDCTPLYGAAAKEAARILKATAVAKVGARDDL
jgi:hypothetical protein